MDKGKKGAISRRRFLQLAGAAGVLAVPLGAGIPLLKKASAEDPAQQEATHQAVEQATNRQWCMVVDLRKCEGCTTIDAPPQCVQACIEGHYVPEGQQWIEIYQKEGEGGGSFFMPAPCMQCENAPCVNVCPVGATYHNPQGIVLIDHRRCIGCRLCMAACPYQRRFFNWGEPRIPREAYFVKYTPEFPAPAIKGTVMKCIFCAHRTAHGQLPICVEGCPMKALYLGDLNEDVATNGMEVVTLSRFISENDAYRYKDGLGTQPRVWYIPGHGHAFGRMSDATQQKKPNYWPWGVNNEQR